MAKADIDSVNAHVDNQIGVIKAILETFQARLEAGDSARLALEKQIEQSRFSATSVKGRVGGLEGKLAGLERDLSELEVAKAEQCKEAFDGAPPQASATDGFSVDFQGQLTSIGMTFAELRNDVMAQGIAISDLQLEVAAKGDGKTGRFDHSNLSPGAPVSSHSKWGTSDLDEADFASEESPATQTEIVSHCSLSA